VQTLLDSGYTWFLEDCSQLPTGELRIRLAEGIKGTERVPVPMGGEVVRTFFPVTIQSSSRVMEVVFENAHAFFTCNESYSGSSADLVTDHRGRLTKVASSLFRNHVSTATSVFALASEPIFEWFLWTEDQVFQILASEEPKVVEMSSGPDLTIVRGKTWASD